MNTPIANESGTGLSTISRDPASTRWIGSILGAAVRELGRGVLVELHGPLGAGKTTLSQGIGAGMGLRERVTSPTFALVHEHGSIGDGAMFVHVDLYRIGTEDEVRELALEEVLDAGGLVAVEWPERAGGFLEEAAQDVLTITMRPIVGDGDRAVPEGSDLDEEGAGPRRLDFAGRGRFAEKLVAKLRTAVETLGADVGVRLSRRPS